LNDRRRELKQAFIDRRGFWNDFWDGLLQLDPDFFEAYLGLSGLPWSQGKLEPKIKELIYIAVDASATHLYEPGIRQHVKNALDLGATKEEIMEVYELTAAVGIHSCTVGVPILIDELVLHGQLREGQGLISPT
jgi:Carboxymuconolactone decarboxylase family